MVAGKHCGPFIQGAHREPKVVGKVHRAMQGPVMKLNIDRVLPLFIAAGNKSNGIPH